MQLSFKAEDRQCTYFSVFNESIKFHPREIFFLNLIELYFGYSTFKNLGAFNGSINFYPTASLSNRTLFSDTDFAKGAPYTTGFPNIKFYFFMRLRLVPKVLVQTAMLYLVLDTT